MTGTWASAETVVRGPVTGQAALCEAVMRAAPDWFGIEQALLEYAADADALPTFVAGHAGEELGFLTVKPTSDYALEVYVMAVRPVAHRRGVGRALMEAAVSYARRQGCEIMHVKTLSHVDPDAAYAGTRAFYAAMGFRPLETIPEIWGEANPCLIMVKPLGAVKPLRPRPRR